MTMTTKNINAILFTLIWAGLGSVTLSQQHTYSFETRSSSRRTFRTLRVRENASKRNLEERAEASKPTLDEVELFDRVLQEEMGSYPVAGNDMDAVVEPTPEPETVEPTSTTENPEAAAATEAPETDAPETEAPESCPARLEVECVEVNTGTPCKDLGPPEGASGESCFVFVEYTYNIVNEGDVYEQIYTLVVSRSDRTTVVTDIPDAIPTTILSPGASVSPTETLQLDLCTALGSAVLDTETTLITGPASSVQVGITCESENGVECRSISDDFLSDPDPDACLLDVFYTYTVSNTGQSDFNIIAFTRRRNDEFVDLMPLLGTDVFLAAGESKSVQESETIDRCVDQTFSTSIEVTKLPVAEVLCQEVVYYP